MIELDYVGMAISQAVTYHDATLFLVRLKLQSEYFQLSAKYAQEEVDFLVAQQRGKI